MTNTNGDYVTLISSDTFARGFVVTPTEAATYLSYTLELFDSNGSSLVKIDEGNDISNDPKYNEWGPFRITTGDYTEDTMV